MIKKLLILIILLSSIVFADLSNYPEPFIVNERYNNLTVVIGSGDIPPNSYAATQIILGMPTNQGDSNSFLDTQISNLNRNMIIVGTPCTNMLVARFLETQNCNVNLNSGEGLIKLMKNERNTILIITGYDSKEIKNIGDILRNYQKYNLEGDTLIVKGSEIQKYNYTSPVVEQPKIINECKTVGEIITNKYYCSVNKKITPLKELDKACVNNYECLNQDCYNSQCYQGLFSKLWDWIKSLF